MIIDVLVTSSSRFEHFKRTIKSFLDKVKNKDGYRLHLHEDVNHVAESESILHWSKDVFETVLTTEPHKGRAAALKKLKNCVKSTYFFHLEQDWEFIKPVDLGLLISFMRKNVKANQLAFHTYRHPVGQNWENKVADGITFWRSKYWHMSPALWRGSFAKKHWSAFKEPDSRRAFQQAVMEEHGKFGFGSYAFGKLNEYVIHLGPDDSTPETWL